MVRRSHEFVLTLEVGGVGLLVCVDRGFLILRRGVCVRLLLLLELRLEVLDSGVSFFDLLSGEIRVSFALGLEPADPGTVRYWTG